MSILVPSDISLERSVLAAVVFSDEARMTIMYELTSEDLYHPPHSLVFLHETDRKRSDHPDR